MINNNNQANGVAMAADDVNQPDQPQGAAAQPIGVANTGVVMTTVAERVRFDSGLHAVDNLLDMEAPQTLTSAVGIAAGAAAPVVVRGNHAGLGYALSAYSRSLSAGQPAVPQPAAMINHRLASLGDALSAYAENQPVYTPLHIVTGAKLKLNHLRFKLMVAVEKSPVEDKKAHLENALIGVNLFLNVAANITALERIANLDISELDRGLEAGRLLNFGIGTFSTVNLTSVEALLSQVHHTSYSNLTIDYALAKFYSAQPCFNGRINTFNSGNSRYLEKEINLDQTVEENISHFYQMFSLKFPEAAADAIKFYQWIIKEKAIMNKAVKDNQVINAEAVLDYIENDPLMLLSEASVAECLRRYRMV